MRKPKTVQFSAGRYWLVLGCMALVLFGIVYRIVQLQFIERDFLLRQGNARTVRTVDIQALRGIITDRNGEPLAATTTVDSIWVNPKEIAEHQPNLSELASLLGTSKYKLTQKLARVKEREFYYLKRQVNPELSASIKALKLPGVYSKREYRRYYPLGEVAAHVVGFTDVDDRGQEGMELAYDTWLRGTSGKRKILRDRLGRVISELDVLVEPVSGNQLTLSIDRRLQYLAHRELRQAVKKYQARSGSLVILDVNTGEVLAMTNQPAFNPNNRHDMQSQKIRNRAVTDIFEPGSVIKSFSMVAALEEGGYELDHQVDTSPGVMRIDDNTVRDIRNYGRLDLTGIIRKSSNIGISKLLLDLRPNVMADTLTGLGFGQVSGSGFPGEVPGKVVRPLDSDRFSQSTQAFGYGVSVTALQLAKAYATLGAFGVKHPISLLKVDADKPPKGQRVFSKETAAKVLTMLKTVIANGGSGTRARIPGYEVTGKTGTSRKATNSGYADNRHQAVFAGLIPANKPRLALVVMVDEPQGAYYGGLVAAPVFAKVMAGAVRFLDIPPTDLTLNQVI